MFLSLVLLLVGALLGWTAPRLLAWRAAARKVAPRVATTPTPAAEQAPNDSPPPVATVSPEMDEIFSVAAGFEGSRRRSSAMPFAGGARAGSTASSPATSTSSADLAPSQSA